MVCHMEHVLTNFKTGSFNPKSINKKDKQEKEFVDAYWGNKMHAWVIKMTQLWSDCWDCILFDATAFKPALEEEYNGEDVISEDEVDPHMLIVLD